MRTLTTRRSLATVAALAVTVGGGYLAGSALAAGSVGAVETPARTNPASGTKWATSDFPMNSKGQTYGSDSEANKASEMPDLIVVSSDAGELGFLKKTELLEAEPESFGSPAEALEWQAAVENTGGVALAVYDVEGSKQIGTFTLALGETKIDGR